jgi:hypothetical protein
MNSSRPTHTIVSAAVRRRVRDVIDKAANRRGLSRSGWLKLAVDAQLERDRRHLAQANPSCVS